MLWDLYYIPYFWMRMHPYTYLCLPVCPPVCLSQLALSKDDINAHPLRPMSYWFLKNSQSEYINADKEKGVNQLQFFFSSLFQVFFNASFVVLVIVLLQFFGERNKLQPLNFTSSFKSSNCCQG